MAESYTVGGLRLDKPCVACSTTGVVATPEWAEYTAKYLHDDVKPTTLLEWEKENPPPLHVNEEMPCPECDGVGFQLTLDGRLLLQFLRRHGR